MWALALWWWAISLTAVSTYAVLMRSAALTRGPLGGLVAGMSLALAGGLALQDGTLMELLRAGPSSANG